MHEPTTDEVTKDYGTPTTEDDVTGAVTIPDYPSDKEQPTIKVDDQVNYQMVITRNIKCRCNGNISDGTQDHVTVPVTTNKQITMLMNQQRMKLQRLRNTNN